MKSNPKERPILFTAENVNAIIKGTKTQTRRVLKLPSWSTDNWADFEIGDNGEAMAIASSTGCLAEIQCPYGQPGDLLWVRETHHIDWYPEGVTDSDGFPGTVHYRANKDVFSQSWQGQWRPSIHMPRWASRILLKVEAIRVERLQKITEEDAIAEGCTKQRFGNARDDYIDLWDHINFDRGYGWNTNPWVWVVTFSIESRRITWAEKQAPTVTSVS